MRMQPLPEPRLVTVKYAAALLGVSTPTVHGLIASGELPGFRIGKCVRIPKEALEDYVNSWRTDETPDEEE